MKTLTKNDLSLYLFDESEPLTITEDNISVGSPAKFVIADCNSNNTTLHEGVVAPEDWSGCKYFYRDSLWTLNPDWVEPVLEEEEN